MPTPRRIGRKHAPRFLKKVGFERLEDRAMLSVNGDFNGDGFDDLAVGVPGEWLVLERQAGAVNVIYGSADRLSATGNQYWTQDSAGISGTAEEGDLFGAALAVGDFDNDGFDDLAIGAPGEALGDVIGAGGVHILYGSASGLTATGDDWFTQDSDGIQGVAQTGDNFGYTLAAGDFNNDGRDDLAIGSKENFGELADVGAVHVLYGTDSGLGPANDQVWSQDSSGISGAGESGDNFGGALTTGDFNGDNRDDLAIGSPGEDIGEAIDAGMIHVLYGSSSRLNASNSQGWYQGNGGLSGAAESNDQFGAALASGDFDNDGEDDLAIGAPGENGIGAVGVIYGTTSRLKAAGNKTFLGGDLGAVEGSAFGRALASGDFNNDGEDELAIGSPYDSSGEVAQVGKVYVLRGTGSGLTAAGVQMWDENVIGMKEVGLANENFGAALSVGDYDNDGREDLAVGVPYDVIEESGDVGSVHVIYGASSGLHEAGDQIWNQALLAGDGAQNDDGFGAALGNGGIPTFPLLILEV